MNWLGLAIYVWLGILGGGSVGLYAVAKRKAQAADCLLLVASNPELWIAILAWPIGLPWLVWKVWKEPPAPEAPVIPSQVQTHLLGREGVVMQALRPSGVVQIDETDYEAVAQFGVITEGEQVTVVEQDSLRLSVKRTRGGP